MTILKQHSTTLVFDRQVGSVLANCHPFPPDWTSYCLLFATWQLPRRAQVCFPPIKNKTSTILLECAQPDLVTFTSGSNSQENGQPSALSVRFVNPLTILITNKESVLLTWKMLDACMSLFTSVQRTDLTVVQARV